MVARPPVPSAVRKRGKRTSRLRRRKSGQRPKLHVCGMPLQHHEGEMFLDVAIDAARAGGGGEQGLMQRRMLVGSSSGKLSSRSNALTSRSHTGCSSSATT